MPCLIIEPIFSDVQWHKLGSLPKADRQNALAAARITRRQGGWRAGFAESGTTIVSCSLIILGTSLNEAGVK
jgi:hypothetical protein